MRFNFGLKNINKGLLVRNFLLIICGSFISAVGINTFLVPHKFISSGFGGLSLFLSYLTPVSVATYLLIFNIPIFLFGWRYVGRVFVLGSLVGTIAFSLGLYFTAWMAHTGWEPEPMLSALVGGALSGGGAGLVFRASGSQGGTDIVAAAVRKRWSLSIGSVVFVFNAAIVLCLGFVYGLHAALYSLLAQFCSAMALDKVMLGWDRRRALFIISSEPQKIAREITKKLGRGVTFLEGEGAFFGGKQKVIFCVVSLRQLARAKYFVQSMDPNAFMTVAEVSEVLGKGFKSVPI